MLAIVTDAKKRVWLRCDGPKSSRPPRLRLPQALTGGGVTISGPVAASQHLHGLTSPRTALLLATEPEIVITVCKLGRIGV